MSTCYGPYRDYLNILLVDLSYIDKAICYVYKEIIVNTN